MNRSTKTGFTLLEVLIALVVVSVGLLGILTMQLTGMQHNTDAYMRTQATELAQQIIDRSYANQTAIDRYQSLDCAESGCKRDGKTVPPIPPDYCNTADCTNDQIADLDVMNWQANLTGYLPGARGWVCHGSVTQASPLSCDNTGDAWLVTIMWDERRSGKNGTGCDPADSEDLQCYRVSFVATPAT